MQEYALQEITLGVCRVNAPPVVCKDVEDTENEHKETGRPLGLEPNRDHDTGSETKDGDNHSHEGPLTLDDESEEEEDQEHTTGQEEAETYQILRAIKNRYCRSLFLAVCLRD
jgi:hypothetical protein